MIIIQTRVYNQTINKAYRALCIVIIVNELNSIAQSAHIIRYIR